MNDERNLRPDAEVFAAACAIELPESTDSLVKGTYTTGVGTGSDIDDQ